MFKYTDLWQLTQNGHVTRQWPSYTKVHWPPQGHSWLRPVLISHNSNIQFFKIHQKFTPQKQFTISKKLASLHHYKVFELGTEKFSSIHVDQSPSQKIKECPIFSNQPYGPLVILTGVRKIQKVFDINSRTIYEDTSSIDLWCTESKFPPRLYPGSTCWPDKLQIPDRLAVWWRSCRLRHLLQLPNDDLKRFVWFNVY